VYQRKTDLDIFYYDSKLEDWNYLYCRFNLY